MSLGDADVDAAVVDPIDAEVRRALHVTAAQHAPRALDEADPEADDRLPLRDVRLVDVPPNLGARRRAVGARPVDRPSDDVGRLVAREAEQLGQRLKRRYDRQLQRRGLAQPGCAADLDKLLAD